MQINKLNLEEIQEALSDDAVAADIGDAIASEVQCLCAGGRYFLASGSKTAAGLARAVFRLIAEQLLSDTTPTTTRRPSHRNG